MLTFQRAPVVIKKFYVLTFSILFINTQDSAWIFYIIFESYFTQSPRNLFPF